MKNGRIQLETLSCPSCIAKIEGLLKKTNGVEDYKVLFNASRVNLSYDTDKVSLADVASSIESLGYEVKKFR